MNSLLLVGRITTTPQLDYTSDDKAYTTITIAVTRYLKEEDTGAYETDFIPVLITDEIAKTVCEYVKKGDTIGIKGTLQTRYNENNTKYLVVIPDKVTFLQSSSTSTDQYTQDDTNNMITPNTQSETNPLNEGEI